MDYTPEETATWGAVWRALTRLHATHACREYREGFELCERLCGLCERRVPQLRDLSVFLKGVPHTHYHSLSQLLYSEFERHNVLTLCCSAHRLHDPTGRRLLVGMRLSVQCISVLVFWAVLRFDFAFGIASDRTNECTKCT